MILPSLQTFIGSIGFRDGLPNLNISHVVLKGFEALQRELCCPKILSCKKVDTLRYAIMELTFVDPRMIYHSR